MILQARGLAHHLGRPRWGINDLCGLVQPYAVMVMAKYGRPVFIWTDARPTHLFATSSGPLSQLIFQYTHRLRKVLDPISVSGKHQLRFCSFSKLEYRGSIYRVSACVAVE